MAHFERKTGIVICQASQTCFGFLAKLMSTKNLNVLYVRFNFCARFPSQIALMQKFPIGVK